MLCDIHGHIHACIPSVVQIHDSIVCVCDQSESAEARASRATQESSSFGFDRSVHVLRSNASHSSLFYLFAFFGTSTNIYNIFYTTIFSDANDDSEETTRKNKTHKIKSNRKIIIFVTLNSTKRIDYIF